MLLGGVFFGGALLAARPCVAARCWASCQLDFEWRLGREDFCDGRG